MTAAWHRGVGVCPLQTWSVDTPRPGSGVVDSLNPPPPFTPRGMDSWGPSDDGLCATANQKMVQIPPPLPRPRRLEGNRRRLECNRRRLETKCYWAKTRLFKRPQCRGQISFLGKLCRQRCRWCVFRVVVRKRSVSMGCQQALGAQPEHTVVWHRKAHSAVTATLLRHRGQTMTTAPQMGECLPGTRPAHARRTTFVLSILSLAPGLSSPREVPHVDRTRPQTFRAKHVA